MIEKYYKRKYILVFYERDDDTLKCICNNVVDVCNEFGIPVTEKNINKVKVDLYRSLRRKNHQTNILRGQCLRVYIVDITDERDE